jgi:hypothetical protein
MEKFGATSGLRSAIEAPTRLPHSSEEQLLKYLQNIDAKYFETHQAQLTEDIGFLYVTNAQDQFFKAFQKGLDDIASGEGPMFEYYKAHKESD